MTENRQTKGNILAVDDTPANLQLLTTMIKEWGYKGRAAPSGPLALQAVEKDIPDLILLDINMPDMDGYSVCQQLKANAALRDIPVIFISALSEAMDKVKAFNVGGVDYVTKPFQCEEVKARIETHMKLRQLQIAEQELREKTLKGAVKVMSDMLSLTAPEVAARAKHVQRLALSMAKFNGLNNIWELELAARLSQIGALALSESTVKKALAGAVLSDKEQQMWARIPDIGQRLLSNIPRLEAVAALVGLRSESAVAMGSEFRQQCNILRAAVMAVDYIEQGLGWPEVLKCLQDEGSIDESAIAALARYDDRHMSFESRVLTIKELTPAMILEQDISTRSGQVLLSKGQELNPLLIERLFNFAANGNILEPLRVQVPSGIK